MSSRDAIDSDEFARLMGRCGPFEPRPLLVLAVSGGADSMALALLADDWARARRGRIVALTVDHGLRRDARAEARTVARRLKARGIAHRVLPWSGPKPETGLQAAARAARYRLLTDWCRGEGALHLLLGHTRDDLAETVLLRLAAGSGPHGLAAMPPVVELAAVRLLRPLLGVARTRLAATLRARGQDWIEDPSNRDDRFARIRVRRLLAALAGSAAQTAALARSASELARFRAAQERKIAETLARAVAVQPQGFARLDPAALAAAPPEIGWRAFAALLAAIGGLDYLPRGDAVRRLHSVLCAGRIVRGRTLARCRLIPAGAAWLVARESRGIEAARLGARPLSGWDGRFDITGQRGREVGALGAAGWAELLSHAPGLRASVIPYPARLSLPAIRDRRGVAAVPGLAYLRGQDGRRKNAAIATFRPPRPLAAAAFAAPLMA